MLTGKGGGTAPFFFGKGQDRRDDAHPAVKGVGIVTDSVPGECAGLLARARPWRLAGLSIAQDVAGVCM